MKYVENGLASAARLLSFGGLVDFSSPAARVFAEGVLQPALMRNMKKEKMRSTFIACSCWYAGGTTTRAVEVGVSANVANSAEMNA